jgi:hypothetical protein
MSEKPRARGALPMDYSDISPKYLMKLIPKVEVALWDLFESAKYQNVRRYIEKWHEVYDSFGDNQNFYLFFKDDKDTEINLSETLHRMPNDILIKIAIDLDVDTPGFLPVVPEFKNILKDQNQSAYQNFTRATKNVHENPDQAVSLASSTLEGIIKTILAHDTFSSKADTMKNKPLTKLVAAIVKELGFDSEAQCPQEIITLAAQLRGLGATIDDIRSDKSSAHGKAHDECVVDDPLWAAFIVNACATLGLFLWEYFEKKYKPQIVKQGQAKIADEDAINLDDISF